MSWYVYCANCGRQILLDGVPGENCLFCGWPVHGKAPAAPSETTNKKKDTMVKKNGAAEAVPPRPKKRKKMWEYFEENKEAIIEDYYRLKIKDFLSRWHLCSTTWIRLKKKWGGIAKNVRLAGTPIRREIKLLDPHALTEHEHYLILFGYRMAVKEILGDRQAFHKVPK